MSGELVETRAVAGADVLVIGSGIAGLYAALLASRYGRVVLVTKSELEESNTRYAQGGIAAAIGAGDSPELHLRDTLAAGDGLCDPESVAVLTREAPERIADLIRLGVPFDRENGSPALTREAAHSLARILHAGGDATGAGIERTLARAVRESGVRLIERASCTSLIVEGDRARGAVFEADCGNHLEVRAPAVILATGGAGRLYARTTNPAVATGDGQALAYRAGAALADLEFMQFHPTALAIDGAPPFLVSEAVRGEGGILRDRFGDAFMERYHPDRELAPRDVVARAIHTQMHLTESDHVFLDVRHLDPERVEARFPSIVSFCRQYGIEPLRESMPVSPAAHYWMGGVWSDSQARTTLLGLYACGEVACTGVHGANRLASNSLLEGLVFAARAVDSIVAGDGAALVPEGEMLAPTRCQQYSSISDDAIAQVMWDHAGLVRSATSLDTARRALLTGSSMRRNPSGEVAVPQRRESSTRSPIALLAPLLLDSASLREESRGGHFREDYPGSNPDWLGRIVVSLDGARFVPLLRAAVEEICA